MPQKIGAKSKNENLTAVVRMCAIRDFRRIAKMRSRLFSSGLLALSVMLASCGGGGEPARPGDSSGTTNEKASLNKDDYPVFPDADAGADPAVSAEQGGKGFTGQGWETNTSFDLQGDPRAAKGGSIISYLDDFPGTLRMEGPENNTFFNYGATVMAYETLLS